MADGARPRLPRWLVILVRAWSSHVWAATRATCVTSRSWMAAALGLEAWAPAQISNAYARAGTCLNVSWCMHVSIRTTSIHTF